RWTSARPPRWWSWRSSCRSWRRFTPRGARRGSIRSKLCATNETLTMAADTPVLYLHGIERRYQQGDVTLEILKGAELAAWAGQSVALIAPSGSGKSTLLHIAGLLEHQDAGEVYIDQVATSSLSDNERTRIRRTEIGFVYQFHHLLAEFSALENVMLPQM